MEKQKPKEELTLKYTHDELVLEATDLEQDKDVELFLRVEKGARKYNKYLQIVSILEQNKK